MNNAEAPVLELLTSGKVSGATISVDAMLAHLVEYRHVNRRSVIAVLKALHKAGRGKFIVGRHGSPSRFQWYGPVEPQAANSTYNVLYPLRPEHQVHISLPLDYTKRELDRLAVFILNLE